MRSAQNPCGCRRCGLAIENRVMTKAMREHDREREDLAFAASSEVIDAALKQKADLDRMVEELSGQPVA